MVSLELHDQRDGDHSRHYRDDQELQERQDLGAALLPSALQDAGNEDNCQKAEEANDEYFQGGSAKVGSCQMELSVPTIS